VLAELRSEAERLEIPYQTLISNILHRYVKREAGDSKSIDLSRVIAKDLYRAKCHPVNHK